MIRFACPASSSCTAIRSSLTVSGNGVRDMSDAIIVAIPCVSSRPRTTSASICDGVRKMTMRSGIGHTATRPTSANAWSTLSRIIVMSSCWSALADERLDLAQDALAQLSGLEVAVLLDDAAETGLAEEIALGGSSPR